MLTQVASLDFELDALHANIRSDETNVRTNS